MSKKKNLYLGKAGQFAVMSEFLVKGWNVAIPEVDIGDDIFVVKDENGDFFRVQVKTATGKETNYGYSAQFNIPINQLQKVFTPDLFYVLAVRFDSQWHNFVVISRYHLLSEHQIYNVGSKQNNQLLIYIQYREGQITCSSRDWTNYQDDFNNWENIDH